MRLYELALASSWPPCRDALRYDSDWLLYIWDGWRTRMCGIPSVFE